MRACGAERGAVARRRYPTSGAARGARARLAGGAAHRHARAPGPGARDHRARARVRAAARPRRRRGSGERRGDACTMRARGSARRRAAAARGWQVGGEGTRRRGCKQRTPANAEFWCRRQDAMWPGVLRHQIQFWDPSPFGVEGGFSGAGRTAAEGWARARPEWGIHRAPRRAELVHETRSSRATPATAWMSTDCLRARGFALAGPSVARSRRKARASFIQSLIRPGDPWGRGRRGLPPGAGPRHVRRRPALVRPSAARRAETPRRATQARPR